MDHTPFSTLIGPPNLGAFLSTYREKLAAFTDDELHLQKQGLIQKLLEAPKNLGEEMSRFWYHVDEGDHDFMQGEHSLIRMDSYKIA